MVTKDCNPEQRSLPSRILPKNVGRTVARSQPHVGIVFYLPLMAHGYDETTAASAIKALLLAETNASHGIVHAPDQLLAVT